MALSDRNRVPVENRFGIVAGFITSLCSLIVYVTTLRPEVDRGDSAELALQAFRLGATHPPGYPVHTVLGKLFTLFFSEPAIATNVMSAVFTAMTVGILALFLYQVTSCRAVSLAAPLVFAFSPIVWRMAVTTEVYNVNVFFFAVVMFLVYRWCSRPSVNRLVAAAVLYGISLGSYLGNLLLLPAFIFLIVRKSKSRATSTMVFTVITIVTGFLVLSWSFFRAGTAPPLGTEYLPNSPAGFTRYLAGAQYGTIELQGFGFYASRALEHANIFAKNYLGVGVLFGLAGLLYLYREKTSYATFTLLAFVINIGYFTAYKVSDYFLMVTPAYFIFALWIGCGARLVGKTVYRDRRLGPPVYGLLGLVALVLLVVHLPDRLEQRRSRHVTAFAESSFLTLPDNAVVFAQWQNFTVLCYFQTLYNARTDLTLAERQTAPRYYTYGSINGYLDYIDRVIADRPVVIDTPIPRTGGKYEVTPIGDGWYRIAAEIR